MLTSIKVKGFRCLRDVSIGFEPLTVMIGPNDSGKSSILDCLVILSKISRLNLNDKKEFMGRYDLLENLSREDKKTGSYEFSVLFANAGPGREEVSYGIRLDMDGDSGTCIGKESLEFGETMLCWPGADGKAIRRVGPPVHIQLDTRNNRRELTFAMDPNVPESDRRVLLSLRSLSAYSLRTESLARPCKSQVSPEIKPDGGGLAAVLENYAGAERDRFDAIEKELCNFSSMVSGINIKPTEIKNEVMKVVHVKLSDGDEIPAYLASDGILYALGFLTLIHSPARPMALLVEEPENGIHPRNLGMIMDFFRRLSEGQIGGEPVQVIMATHSPYLLDCAEPEEVRIVTRTRDSGTRVTRLDDAPHLEERLRDFKLGELWTNVGDEALAGEDQV